MLTDQLLVALFILSVAVVAYHHVGYPIILRRLAQAQRRLSGHADERPRTDQAGSSDAREPPPTLTLIVPAHNEANVIAQKIANLAALDYPRDRLSVVIALDGCTDESKVLAEAAIARAGRDFDIRLVEYKTNRGKIPVLNELIAAASADIIALSDASALISADAALRAARHFANGRVGVVCGTYKLTEAGSEGERKYWEIQTRIKQDEAELAAPMGAHGALYFFRRPLWQPLPEDTINDDFILPMEIVANGHRGIYDTSIVATELETTKVAQEFRRRVRIGAGNMQQLVRLSRLADPRTGELAFVFVSGKGMRPIVPFLILLAVLSTAFLAMRGERFFQLALAGELALFSLASVAIAVRSPRTPRLMAWLGYMVEGHAASAVGALTFLTGQRKQPWKPAARSHGLWENNLFIPFSVVACKRIFDIVVACVGLLLFAILYVPVALAIKLDSPGPVLFRQTRVGRSTRQSTDLFELVKFRSMQTNAEAGSGPQFSKRNDVRVTRVGKVLRATRLDELPQFWNVLVGDMSIVGPRPERPFFVGKNEGNYPFYCERTSGLKPGITGLAQVNQDYEQSVKDVDTKIQYDLAYVLRLTSWWSWLKTDLYVMLKTVYVVFARTGA